MKIQLSVILSVVCATIVLSQELTLSSRQIDKTFQAVEAYIRSEAKAQWKKKRVLCSTLAWRPIVAECELPSFFICEGGLLSSYSINIHAEHIRIAELNHSLPQVEFRDSADIKIGLVPVYYFSPVLFNPGTGEYALQVIVVALGEFYSTVAVLKEEENALVVKRFIDSYIRYD